MLIDFLVVEELLDYGVELLGGVVEIGFSLYLNQELTNKEIFLLTFKPSVSIAKKS